MSLEPEQELRQLALQLRAANKSVVKTIVEGRLSEIPELLGEYARLKKEIRILLASFSVTQIQDQEARELILKISQGTPLEADKIIKSVEDQSGEALELEDLDDDEIDKLGSEWFYSWISHYEYVRNLYHIGSLIVSFRVPETLQIYLRELRECYALQQPNAVIALCRTILEATAKDLCERKGLLHKLGSNVVEINPRVFNQLISAVAPAKLKKRASRLYYHDACPVIHGDRVVNADQSLQVLRETMSVVQELYSSAGL
jgi:hypothetical protein